MMLSKYFSRLMPIVTLIYPSTSLAQQIKASLTVDAQKVEQKITPWLYGSCIEDVNHEIYGGIYNQLIFGESFEEPIPNPKFDNFSTYEGIWKLQNQTISVAPFSGAKLIFDRALPTLTSVETDIKLERGDNAGMLLRVSKPGNGADNFYGYEISIATSGSQQKMIIGKHKNNFEHIKDVPIKIDSRNWNNLKAVFIGGKIQVFLNQILVYTIVDNDPDLKAGKVGLRNWNSSASFQNFKIETNGKEEKIIFKSTPTKQISRQWTALETGTAKSNYQLDTISAFNGKNTQVFELISGSGKIGITNASLNGWGIAVNKGKKLQGSIYLKSQNTSNQVMVALQSADGKTTYAETVINKISAKWNKHVFNFTANATDPKARFAIYTKQQGKIWVDQVKLAPVNTGRFEGLPFRSDIANAMIDQGLTFLRYGGTMVNTEGYRFKNMIGDPNLRPPYKGHWYPYSTNGFGIEEFLKLCEVSGFTAAFAINIEETPQDIAHMIEYLNGPENSIWGKKRVQNGHPKPYGIKYIGIGNEEVLFNGDRADEYDHYIERFNMLYDAIKGKDASIKLVNTAWWRPESANAEKVFRALDGKADYWDYHPWTDQLTSGKEVGEELEQMQRLFLKWNPATKMKCAIFEENGNSHNIQRTLGHVTLQNAVRRMGDFVLTSCAANALQPYLQNDNGWDQGQIFFTPSQVWGMPPYYAQQIAAKYHQPLLVKSFLTDTLSNLDVTATRSENGNELVLHIANVNNKAVTVDLKIDGFKKIVNAKSITIAGNLSDINTPKEPKKIIPITKTISNSTNQTLVIAPHAYTIISFSK